MSENKFAEALKVLCSEYYNRNISMVEYRARRKQLIDQMDVEHNGGGESTNELDITQRQPGAKH